MQQCQHRQSAYHIRLPGARRMYRHYSAWKVTYTHKVVNEWTELSRQHGHPISITITNKAIRQRTQVQGVDPHKTKHHM